MNKEPLVSVLIPSYNSGKYLDDSVGSILDQSYSNWELIISDDCSTDDSFQIAKRYESQDKRIKAFRNKKKTNAM